MSFSYEIIFKSMIKQYLYWLKANVPCGYAKELNQEKEEGRRSWRVDRGWRSSRWLLKYLFHFLSLFSHPPQRMALWLLLLLSFFWRRGISGKGRPRERRVGPQVHLHEGGRLLPDTQGPVRDKLHLLLLPWGCCKTPGSYLSGEY